jgi:hypothetical protein
LLFCNQQLPLVPGVHLTFMRPTLLVSMLLVLSCWAAAADQSPCPEPVTHLVIEKGNYSPAPGAVFFLQGFSANMVSHSKKQPECSKRSTEIQRGDVYISADSLTKFFNRRMEKTSSKINEIQVEIKDGKLHLKGKVHKGIDIPFDVEGQISTDGRNLIVQAKKIKAEGLPMKGLLGMVGVHLASLVNSGQVNGVVAKDDTLTFEPDKIANVQGKITKAYVTGDGVEIAFGAASNRQQARK